MTMSVILRLTKGLAEPIQKSKTFYLPNRAIRSSPSLLWLNRTQLKSSKYREEKYMEKDKVPSGYQLIYRAPMEGYVAWSMHVSTFTASVIGVAAMYQYLSNQPLLEPAIDTKLVMHSEDIYYFSAGFIAINAVMRLVVSKFPLRIYKNNGKYLAVYHSQLPGGQSHHHFNQGEVKQVNYIFSPWNNVTYKLGSKTSLLLEDYFKTPSEFHKMSTTNE